MKKAFGAVPQEPTEETTGYEPWEDDDDRYSALVQANRSLAAGLFGGDPIVPPTEFGGSYYGGGPYGAGGGAGFGPGGGVGDINSWPGRYGQGMYGMYGLDGWVYNRVGQSVDHRRIAQCIMMYKTEGVVQTIVHLLADFATEGVKVSHEDKSVHNFYQAWAKKICLSGRVHRFVIDLLTTGQVFAWRKEAKLKASEKTAMKRGVAYGLQGQLYDEQHRTIGDLTREVPKGTKLPWGYVSLNPLQMDVRGSRIAGNHYWVMMLTRDDARALSDKIGDKTRRNYYGFVDDIADTEVNVPGEFKGKLSRMKDGRGQYTHELKLDPDRLTVIHDITKADYEAWATPQIYPALKEIGAKRLMRAGELSALESLKHMITLIKLGNTLEGKAPTREHIQRVASALAAGAQSHYLIWDDLIDGEVLQPDIGRILDPKKYESIDKDIYMALGVSETVMTGKGSYANSFLSIKLLLEKLETIRNKILEWLLFEMKIIAKRMGFRKLPEVRFGLMNLRDENAERKLLTDLFDRGIISQETYLEFFDLTYDHERKRQLREKQNIESDNNPEEGSKDVFGMPQPPVKVDVMKPKGPFRKDDSPQPPKGFGEPQPGGTGGRPTNSKTPQTKKRQTKPQGASLSYMLAYDKARTFVTQALPLVHKCVATNICELHDVPDTRSLTREQKHSLEQLVFQVMAQISPDSKLDEGLVYNRLGIVRTSHTVASNNPIYRSFCEVAPSFDTTAESREGFCSVYAMAYSGISRESHGREDMDSEGVNNLEQDENCLNEGFSNNSRNQETIENFGS